MDEVSQSMFLLFQIFRHFDITIANPYKPWTSMCYGIIFRRISMCISHELVSRKMMAWG
jgi:hypothetical protein